MKKLTYPLFTITPYLYIIAPLATFLCCLLFQHKNLWMGDGFLIRALEQYSLKELIGIKDGVFYISPLTWILAKIGFVPLSYLCGLLYFFTSAFLIKQSSKYLITCFLPLISLFTGYYEVYSLVYALSLLFLYAYITKIDWMKSVLFLLALSAHFVIALPLIFLLSKKWYNYLIILFTLLYFVFMQSFTRDNTLVPLTGYYSLFSWYHIRDLLILLPSFLWIFGIKFTGFIDKQLLLTSLFGLFITFCINPHLGVIRDWDLLSLSVLPITFFLLSMSKSVSKWAIGIQIIFTLFFLVFNSELRTEPMFEIMSKSPQYSREYRNGRTIDVTCYIVKKELGRQDMVDYMMEKTK